VDKKILVLLELSGLQSVLKKECKQGNLKNKFGGHQKIIT